MTVVHLEQVPVYKLWAGFGFSIGRIWGGNVFMMDHFRPSRRVEDEKAKRARILARLRMTVKLFSQRVDLVDCTVDVSVLVAVQKGPLDFEDHSHSLALYAWDFQSQNDQT
jgi:hypothetical protein